MITPHPLDTRTRDPQVAALNASRFQMQDELTRETRQGYEIVLRLLTDEFSSIITPGRLIRSVTVLMDAGPERRGRRNTDVFLAILPTRELSLVWSDRLGLFHNLHDSSPCRDISILGLVVHESCDPDMVALHDMTCEGIHG